VCGNYRFIASEKNGGNYFGRFVFVGENRLRLAAQEQGLPDGVCIFKPKIQLWGKFWSVL
jgi:hypothetical protein